ncbi:hypothetical protein [Pusillimonas sp. ANT_WB101]|uniref:hypothetical protein n=1 Tax=Pusillimonas sp. ANT_WB101 TaxID=2597356 RepID=UPI0011EC68D7|nr:hypothetical protein [Pusillimonas sp. ANT_WB101]KAA0910332.1 hypothetical protein FQ179_00005 [Pusillimonas sp. ANT_WB101]
MATAAPTRQQVRVCIGNAGLPLGSLVYVRHGRRDSSAFAFEETWLAVLNEVYATIVNWREVALGKEVGLNAFELDDFAAAFEHAQMDATAALLGR